jgi:hypothetical protein
VLLRGGAGGSAMGLRGWFRAEGRGESDRGDRSPNRRARGHSHAAFAGAWKSADTVMAWLKYNLKHHRTMRCQAIPEDTFIEALGGSQAV